MIFRSTTTIKYKVRRGNLTFFIFGLHFWMKIFMNFLNLAEFVSLHVIATHGHFPRHQFVTANYLLGKVSRDITPQVPQGKFPIQIKVKKNA